MSEKSAVFTDDLLYGKVQRLIVGRMALVFLLLMANLWRTGGYAQLTGGDNPDGLLLLFAVTAGLTVSYYILMRFNGQLTWQVRTQLLIDVALITWLVWQTGDIISPYVTLYVVLISVGGFFLGKTETLVFAIACATVFTLLSILAAQGAVYSVSGDQPASRVLQIVGVNDIALLLVGLIAARLSERRQLSEELKHTEESFADLHVLHERIVESIGSGLITTDLAGRIYAFNRGAAEITGLIARNVIGKSIFELFGDEIRERVEQCLESGRNGNITPVMFEAGFTNGIGNVTAAATIVPLLGKTGSTTGLIVTFQDITQMKTLEETVRRSDRLAAIGRMAAGLAHEIRNPLGSMSSALQFLQERSARPTEEAALMDVVLRESDRMNSIITNFLAFARPSANGTETGRSKVDIGIALHDCLALIKHSPEVTDQHCFEYIPPEEPLLIVADETQLKQVFWNLARNSIQSMPEGGTLSAELDMVGAEHVRVTFSDTGGGISEKILEHLFEPFTSGSGGTGLGLSIVYKIVQDHGGRINVDSKAGEGTSVMVEFPR